jgi:vesicle-associated membrane protein 7
MDRDNCYNDNNDEDGDIEDQKIDNIRNEIEVVKQTMMNNIDKVVERGENLELLIDKSDTLNQSSFRFNNHARTLRRRLCRQNFLRGCLFAFVILLIIYIIIGSTCGFDFACVQKH